MRSVCVRAMSVLPLAASLAVPRPERPGAALVGKLELSAPFANVLPGQIADVSIFKDAAYRP